MVAAIECSGLTKYYGSTRGIEDLDLSVERGTTYGFLGPNGAGKTTTIRCLLGMLRATRGEARLLGQPVTLDGGALLSRVGYVPGEVHLYERETARWHIDYFAGLRRVEAARARKLVDRLELDTTKTVGSLSKGNKQKLALVLALMHEPELLLFDEPTSGLDPLNQQVVFDIISERVAHGATLLLSSHVLPEVERVCERVAIVRDGRLAAEHNVAELLSRHVRDARLVFSESVSVSGWETVKGLTVVERVSPTEVRAKVTGSALRPLLALLAELPVEDLQITHASLEEVFAEYYRAGGDGSDAGSAQRDRPAEQGAGS